MRKELIDIIGQVEDLDTFIEDEVDKAYNEGLAQGEKDAYDAAYEEGCIVGYDDAKKEFKE